MKIVLGFVATAALAFAMGGCGSSSSGDPFGPDPDLASVQNRFDKPDGTFNANNASQVFENGTSGSSSASELNIGGGGGSGSSSTKSFGLHVLDAASAKGSPFACSALVSGQQSGSCACPSGGSIDYMISGGGQGTVRDGLMKFHMSQCASGDSMVDGSEYLDIHTDTTDQQHQLYSMLLVIDATVTRAGTTKHLDLQARFGNVVGGSSAEIAVKVDDGWVVVSVKSSGDGKSGTWSVRDRNGSWTCTMKDGHGSCSSDKGETKTF